MAITYVNDLRLSEMGTGDNSGTWGTVTNTNLELIGEAFGFGTEAITTNADTHTSTIADGSTDPVRAMYVKYTGTLDSTCTITIGPNTVNKFYYIENGTSGSQDIVISQGSGANVTIPAGDVKAVYLDGAGSGAAVTDAFSSLNVGSFTSNGASTITTADNTAQLTLISTDADANAGPKLKLRRNSASPADDDLIGAIDWTGENSDGDEHDFLNLTARMRDVTAGNEDVAYAWTAYLAGTGREVQSFVNTDASAASMVFNEDSQDIDFRVESNGQTHMLFVDGGNDGVAIGTDTVDGGPLTVQTGNSHATAPTFQSTGTTQLFLKDTDAATDNKYWGFQVSGGSLNIITCDDDKAGGFVTPLELDQTDIKIGTGADLITNTASGTTNTRIGTNAGDSIVASNAGVNNIMIGLNAGTAIDSGDTNIAIGIEALETEDDHANNIAIGYQALHVQDAGVDGYNIAIGYQAGLDNTTGIRNIMIGASAGAQASTATSHTAVGYNAGGGVSANPLTGNENTCLGYEAGKAIEGTTANNTFVGSQSGLATTTGYENVAIGYRAMYGNVQGRHNVAIGVQALDVSNPSSAGSQYNVAVGAYSGLANSTGLENVFIGGLSARNNTTANYNVMIGYSVGYNATTAGNSVFIGNAAAQGVDGNKLTGDNNTAVGKSAGFKLQGAATDNTFLGREAGKLVTEGIQNVFVGSTAGDATENASDNVAVGYDALGANVGGQNNVAIGTRALRDATVSSGNIYNTAVGSNAGRNQSSGIQNTYVGGAAGIHTLTNNYTTFLGVNAGYGGAGSELTGHFNTALGYESGFKLITSATKNTFVGTYSGYFNGTTSTANGITTGANNTCIGYAAYPSSATVSDEFTLGDSNISNLRCNDTSISSLSDERDKTNIVDVPLGLDFIKKLRPVAFDWNRRDGTQEGKKDFGFIAQELKTAQDATDYADHMRLVHAGTILVPDNENSNATEDENGMPIRDVSGTEQECLEADPMKTYPVLVKAVQELSTALDAALARIAVLEG